jgi:uncharacterized circularly permuted ATP-grasp superfamily protein
VNSSQGGGSKDTWVLPAPSPQTAEGIDGRPGVATQTQVQSC